MAEKRKRLTLDMEPPMQRRLKAVAALKGISMREYCLSAIEKEMAKDERDGVVLSDGERSDAERPDAERFAQLRRRYFGGGKLPGDSVDLIREAREIRDAQMDQW